MDAPFSSMQDIDESVCTLEAALQIVQTMAILADAHPSHGMESTCSGLLKCIRDLRGWRKTLTTTHDYTAIVTVTEPGA